MIVSAHQGWTYTVTDWGHLFRPWHWIVQAPTTGLVVAQSRQPCETAENAARAACRRIDQLVASLADGRPV